MDVSTTEIPGVMLLAPKKHGDARGFFSETYTRRGAEASGIGLEFVQDNHAWSAARGVVRGLHYQLPPHAQAKLVRVSRGAIFDVAVDIRRSSPTFGRHVSAILSAKEWNQILVPAGFAHGYCTLEPDTEVLYKTSGYYAPAHERGILWNDVALGIAWPVTQYEAILSEKDRCLPALADAVDLFD